MKKKKIDVDSREGIKTERQNTCERIFMSGRRLEIMGALCSVSEVTMSCIYVTCYGKFTRICKTHSFYDKITKIRTYRIDYSFWCCRYWLLDTTYMYVNKSLPQLALLVIGRGTEQLPRSLSGVY